MRTPWSALSLVAVLAAVSCGRLNPVDRTPSVNGLGGAGGSTGGHGGGAGSASSDPNGLPCEVQAVFAKYCESCHGSVKSGGAPRSLVTLADLTRADLTNSKISEAQAAVQRMQDKSSPMPPAPTPGPSADEIAVVDNWVKSGYPKGTCGSGAGGSSQGGGGSGQGGDGVPSGGAGGSSGPVPADGLPCEIQALLVARCESCHGTPTSGGAPRSLVTYANLTSKDPANSSLTEAQVALQRMQSTVAPMPPLPAAGASSGEVAALKSWIDSGYPKGTCGAAGSGGSQAGGGSGGGGAAGAGGGGAGGSAGSSGSVPADGVPCDIQALLVARCESCHGTPTSGGAPRSLVTYANLTSKDPANPSLTEAQVALQRMQSTVAPMPPLPAAGASSSEIAALKTWIDSGYPKGTCGGGGSGGSQAGGGGSGGGGGSLSAGGSSGASDAGTSGTLPCDVQTLLVNRCDSCHGTTPAGGAPRSLVTYGNLTSSDPANPSMTEAQVAVQRMQNTAAPMPPSPASPATSSEIATLQNWINAGYPSGSCSGDAGVPPNDPLNAAPTCTSKTTWNRGTSGSSSMEPGQACIACHSRSGGEAPRFVIAGTLYPTGHEPDNCNGVNGGTTGSKVVVTGSNGASVTLTPNGAGNFYSSTSLPGPYKAKVVNAAGVERVMASTASTGDCNSCHTQNGSNGAPGRITLP